jgi:hypothetical protein
MYSVADVLGIDDVDSTLEQLEASATATVGELVRLVHEQVASTPVR